MSNDTKAAATFTYYGLTLVLDHEELERARAAAETDPNDGEWLTYTLDVGQNFTLELWSMDGGATWRAELSNEVLEVTIDSSAETMTGALDALMNKLRPLGWALGQIKAAVTNWGL